MNQIEGLISGLREPKGRENEPDRLGRKVLEHWSYELRSEFFIAGADGPKIRTFAAKVEVVHRFEVENWPTMIDELGPYFRLLYHVFRLIDKSDMTDYEKLDHAKIARTRLSRSELKIMFLNVARQEGEDFLPLVRKNTLLKHLPQRVKELNPALVEWYGREAFEE